MQRLAILAGACAAALALAFPAASGPGWYITAYCLRGHTATGTRVHPGSVAVDPRIIRLGSRLWISGYGRGRAEDTGSRVLGYHVDVWISSCHRAFRFTHFGVVRVLR